MGAGDRASGGQPADEVRMLTEMLRAKATIWRLAVKYGYPADMTGKLRASAKRTWRRLKGAAA